jgi:hypothetical protein
VGETTTFSVLRTPYSAYVFLPAFSWPTEYISDLTHRFSLDHKVWLDLCTPHLLLASSICFFPIWTWADIVCMLLFDPLIIVGRSGHAADRELPESISEQEIMITSYHFSGGDVRV